MRYLIAILALILAACEKELPLEPYEIQPQLVLNTLAITGEPWAVDITISKKITDVSTEYPKVENAVVEVYVNGNFLEKLVFEPVSKKYTGKTSPEIGKTYTIKASAPGFEEISATETFEVAKKITEVDYKYARFINDSIFLQGKISVSFDVLQGKADYLGIKISGKSLYFEGYETLFLESENPVFSDFYYGFEGKFYLYSEDEFAYFSTKSLPPGKNTIDFSTFLFPENFSYLKVELISLNEGVYNVMKNNFKTPEGGNLVAPVIPHSNVSNKMGYFGAFSTFTLKKYL
jgi:hypothetical protein